MIHPEGSELDAVFVRYVQTSVSLKNNCCALWQIVVRLRDVIITKTLRQKQYLGKNDMYTYVFRLHGKHVLKGGVWPRRNTYF